MKDYIKEYEVKRFTKEMSPALIVIIPLFSYGFYVHHEIAIAWLCLYYLVWSTIAAVIWEES